MMTSVILLVYNLVRVTKRLDYKLVREQVAILCTW